MDESRSPHPAFSRKRERVQQELSAEFKATLGFVLLRTYLSALSRTWPIMLVLLACLAVDAVLSYALIFGRLGAPPLGIVGAGYASAATQWLMFGGLALYAANETALRRHGVL